MLPWRKLREAQAEVASLCASGRAQGSGWDTAGTEGRILLSLGPGHWAGSLGRVRRLPAGWTWYRTPCYGHPVA